ncbi:MAG: transposase [Bryobacterales bacterium]|nr:transposase [Bryobacterales bacterium]
MSKQSYVKAYPKEFRNKVVQLVQVGSRSIREVAEEFGVSTDSVRRWVQQAERDQGTRKDGVS